MKKTELSKLRSRSVDDLRSDAEGLRGDLLKARFATRLEGKAKGVKYRALRRQIARINTIITEKSAQTKAAR